MTGPLAGGGVLATSTYLAAHITDHWGALLITGIGLATFLATLAQYATEKNGPNR